MTPKVRVCAVQHTQFSRELPSSNKLKKIPPNVGKGALWFPSCNCAKAISDCGFVCRSWVVSPFDLRSVACLQLENAQTRALGKKGAF
jgi:hypothetical protein